MRRDGGTMKKFKSIGFATLYLAITFAVQFILMFELAAQMLIIQFKSSVTLSSDRVMEKFQSYSYNLILVSLINLVLICGFGLWYYFIRKRTGPSPVPYRKIMSVKSIGCMAGLAVCSQFVCNLIMIGFQLLQPEVFKEYLKLAEGLDINVLPAWLTLFIVAVWAPLAEELVFRAMIFRTLRKGFSLIPAAVISGALFGIYHMNWVQGVYAGLLGILLAYIYEKTNSLLGSYLFHLIFNLSSYGIEALQKALPFPEVVTGFITMGITFVSVGGIIVFIIYFSKIYKKPQNEEIMQNENI